jgi:hypothetical protein
MRASFVPGRRYTVILDNAKFHYKKLKQFNLIGYNYLNASFALDSCLKI